MKPHKPVRTSKTTTGIKKSISIAPKTSQKKKPIKKSLRVTTTTNPIVTNGTDLVELFIKNPIHYFPVLNKNKIIGFISKKKILRYSTHYQFLEKSIETILVPLIEEKIDPNLFFEEVERQHIKPIPFLVIKANQVELHKKNKEDFFLKYRPVEKITTLDLTEMIEQYNFAMVAFDGAGKLLMENLEAKKIRSMVKMEKSVNPYLYWIKKTDLKTGIRVKAIEKTQTKSYNGFKCIYNLQRFKMNKGMVYLVTILSFKKNP